MKRKQQQDLDIEHDPVSNDPFMLHCGCYGSIYRFWLDRLVLSLCSEVSLGMADLLLRNSAIAKKTCNQGDFSITAYIFDDKLAHNCECPNCDFCLKNTED